MDFFPFILPLSSLPLLVLIAILACQHAREQERQEELKWKLVELRLDDLKEKMIKKFCAKEGE